LLSAIPPKADFARSLRDVSFVPETEIDPNFDPVRRSFIPSAAGVLVPTNSRRSEPLRLNGIPQRIGSRPRGQLNATQQNRLKLTLNETLSTSDCAPSKYQKINGISGDFGPY
jgi:hypothetical protein